MPWTADHGDGVATSSQTVLLGIAYNFVPPWGINSAAFMADHPVGIAQWRESMEAPQARAWAHLKTKTEGHNRRWVPEAGKWVPLNSRDPAEESELGRAAGRT